MKSYRLIMLLSCLLIVPLISAGCMCGKRQAPPPPQVEAETPQMATECGPFVVSRTLPCNMAGSSCQAVQITKEMPDEVQLDSVFNYTIAVKNLCNVTLADVKITEHIPANFEATGAQPEAKKQGDTLTWNIDSLDPNETKEIQVKGKATEAECVKTCATVTYTIPACASSRVVEPKLKLDKTLPREVMLCDNIPAKFVVTNPGTGPAQDVQITDALPEGLETATGGGNIKINAGTLAPGESRQFTVMLKASKTGKYENKAVALADGGLKGEDTATTTVRQPILAITKKGLEKQYLGRKVTYDITVTNKGDAAAQNTIVEDSIPGNVADVTMSDGGTRSGAKAVWNLGTIAPKASRKVSITYTPNRSGTYANSASASAKCADAVEARAETSVVGIPAILLEVIDLVDPVEVGSQTTYVITATNQGSKPGTDIRIVCTLEDAQQYVGSSGATTGTLQGNKIEFTPLQSLAEKAKATWRVVVRAVEPKDVRFKVTMHTGEFERPVEETEATHLYE